MKCAFTTGVYSMTNTGPEEAILKWSGHNWYWRAKRAENFALLIIHKAFVPLFGTLACYFGILPVAKPTGYECRVNVSCRFHLPRFHRTHAAVTKCEVAGLVVMEQSKLLKPLSLE